jgi:hypothetical protein
MKYEYLTVDQVRELLRKGCEEAGGQSAWARKHGLAQPFVSDVLKGKREPGDKLCKALGIEREIRFAPVRRKR